uniref:Putative secreted peptide n=1 Tax=Anopheles braziliensis TaxID=58242 RepID=A0A2M3ZPM2_9DIPT
MTELCVCVCLCSCYTAVDAVLSNWNNCLVCEFSTGVTLQHALLREWQVLRVCNFCLSLLLLLLLAFLLLDFH